MIPSGRLTLVSGHPVMSSDVTGATEVFYSPYAGDTIPLFDGTAWSDVQFTELSLSVVGLAPGAYDIFAIPGPALIAVAFAARPARLNGLLVDAANHTYLGSILLDANGHLNAHFSYGQNRRFDVWNAYHRRRVLLKAGDPRPPGSNGVKFFPHWGPDNFGASNNDPGNSLTVFIGLAEEPVRAIYRQAFFLNTTIGGAGTKYANAVGWNAINGPVLAPPGLWGCENTIDIGTLAASYVGAAEYIAPPFAGYVPVTAFENGRTSGVTCYWSETNMVLSAEWQG